MKREEHKCASIKHGDIEANNYCLECKIFLCNKCQNFHSEILQNHHTYNLNEDINEIFIGICKEKDHFDNLNFYSKSHNQLCCGICISKIKGNGYGQHKDCDVCFVKEIKDEKKNKLGENIKYLEDLSLNLEESINELRKIFEKIDEKKETLKNNIQKIFTKIRNEINDREDKLLLEVDKKFDFLNLKEENFKKSDKLPDKIKKILEKGKRIDNEWNNDKKLNSIINDCIIENNINEIKMIIESIKKYNSNNNDLKIKFIPDDNGINDFLQVIKKFGSLENNLHNLHWINNEVNIVSYSKFYGGFSPDIMLGKNKNHHYSLTDGNRNHFVEFSFIKKYFLKSIRIRVTKDECSLKTFEIEVIDEKGEKKNIGTFIRKKFSEIRDFQEFEINKECQGIKLYLIDNWGEQGGNYILIKNIDFNVSD